MKLLVVVCLVAVAAGFPQNTNSHSSFFSAGPQPTPVNPQPVPQIHNQIHSTSHQSPRGRADINPVNPYGPKAYGMGLNNPYALPPNQFKMNRALALANAHDGLLVRVDVNGKVELTDRFGAEVENLYDNFGRDLTELYDL